MVRNHKYFPGLAFSCLLPGILLLAVWFLAIRQLDLEWTFNPQYQYGWIVPVLTLLLWWRAWPERPPPGEPVAARALPLVVAFLVLAAVPVRIVEEANPDWRLLNYFYAAQAVLVTALVVDHSGGKAWLRHFIFPLLFPLVAVPWPSGLENDVIQGLQRSIASIGVEGASWMGWSSYQRGNLIALSQGTVGINEACSGIRSLQSCLMIALFLGDYFQLVRLRRVVLVVMAVLIAFLFNAVRAFFLIAMMQLRGPAGLSRYHDPAGFGISLGTLLLLWIAASLMAPPAANLPSRPAATAASFRFPKPAFVALLAAWFAAEALNQGWYLWHEQSSRPGPAWAVQWPLPRPDFKNAPIDDSVRTILRYDEGVHGEWTDDGRWEGYFFKWKPSRVATGLAGFHHPDICLQAAGFVMKQDLGKKTVALRGITLPVSRYIFQDPLSGRLFYVFQIVTDDRISPSVENLRESSDGFQRLESAWRGTRNPGQRSLLIVNQGAADFPAAELAVQNLLRDSLVISPAPGNSLR